MRNLLLALGCCGLVGVSIVAACGTTVSDSGGTTATGGTGGGTTTTTSTTTSTHTTSGGGGGSGGGCGADCTPCEQACYKLAVDCGFPISCGQLPNGMLDCSGGDQTKVNCNGNCVVLADCGAIASLAGAHPDAALMSCLQQCAAGAGGGSPCQKCVLQDCASTLGNCYSDPQNQCMPFVQCLQTCTTPECINACKAAHTSTATDAVAACMCGTCGSDCLCGAGGAGGTGGAGGAGGG